MAAKVLVYAILCKLRAATTHIIYYLYCLLAKSNIKIIVIVLRITILIQIKNLNTTIVIHDNNSNTNTSKVLVVYWLIIAC